MLYIVVGPSGAGKTTFINLALKHISNCKVVPVDVCSTTSRNYQKNSGRRKISLDKFEQNLQNMIYSSVCSYLQNKYGFTIPQDYERNDILYLLDYPGEYPECIDIKNYSWKGILILPPSALELRKRLIECNRSDRIKSAEEEYYECLNDICQNRLENAVWSIIINHHIKDMEKELYKLLQ